MGNGELWSHAFIFCKCRPGATLEIGCYSFMSIYYLTPGTVSMMDSGGWSKNKSDILIATLIILRSAKSLLNRNIEFK